MHRPQWVQAPDCGAPAGRPAFALGLTFLSLALEDPDLAQKMRDFGLFSDVVEAPGALGESIRREFATWSKVVREIGLQPD